MILVKGYAVSLIETIENVLSLNYPTEASKNFLSLRMPEFCTSKIKP